jgi:23S rRNA U2552 (ribose-2'-O)-methylase RlmE/FtsJ
MIEMLNIFDIHFNETPIFSFHLAEGPGGFIEALVNTRKNKKDTYIGITLLDNKNDNNIPGWKKSEYFLKNNPNVVIERAKDKTGNILTLDNFVYCKNKYANSMNIITADGGFDFSNDFNNQEISITKLLFAQISYAIVLQKKGGCFILKMFDTFMQHSIDILYILSSFYEKVYIIKPNTSRYANSEKYIVCKNFIYSSQEHYYEYFYNAFKQMVEMENDAFISRFLKTPVSSLFSTKLEEYNGIFGQQQLENIHHTINLIDTQNSQDKVDMLIKSNIQKSTVWCSKYNVPSNFQPHVFQNST